MAQAKDSDWNQHNNQKTEQPADSLKVEDEIDSDLLSLHVGSFSSELTDVFIICDCYSESHNPTVRNSRPGVHRIVTSTKCASISHGMNIPRTIEWVTHWQRVFLAVS
jgi:hypothetical protein